MTNKVNSTQMISQLVNSANKTTLDWQNKVVLDYKIETSTNYTVIDWAAYQLNGVYQHYTSFHPPIWTWVTFKSIDWGQCDLWDTNNIESLNWDSHYCNDSSGLLSIDYNSRYLADHYGNAIVDWENYILSNSDGYQIITFGNGSFKMNDNLSNLSIDYDSRLLSDGSYACVDWGNRNLCDTTGNSLLQFQDEVQFKHNQTGSATALLGTNSPATITTAPYTWVKIKAADGTICYIPAWK